MAAPAARVDADELLAMIEDDGITEHTHLSYASYALDVLHECASQLRSFTLITRGSVRQPDVEAHALVQQWCDQLQGVWAPRGVTVSVVFQERSHLRRCTLRGAGTCVEIGMEYGLMTHIDTARNMSLPVAERAARRAEVVVYEHSVDAGPLPGERPVGAGAAAADAQVAAIRPRGDAAHGAIAPRLDTACLTPDRRARLAELLSRLLRAGRRKS